MDKAEVIISSSIVPPPEPHEVSAAWILARHYNCRVEFLKPMDTFKRRTPDCMMNALEYEIKSPTGDSKRTIKDKLHDAKAQSPNIVIDTRRTKLTDAFVESELRRQIAIMKRISKLIMIDKNEKVLEIKT